MSVDGEQRQGDDAQEPERGGDDHVAGRPKVGVAGGVGLTDGIRQAVFTSGRLAGGGIVVRIELRLRHGKAPC
jgi:hypothetical protein